MIDKQKHCFKGKKMIVRLLQIEDFIASSHIFKKDHTFLPSQNI